MHILSLLTQWNTKLRSERATTKFHLLHSTKSQFRAMSPKPLGRDRVVPSSERHGAARSITAWMEFGAMASPPTSLIIWRDRRRGYIPSLVHGSWGFCS